MNLYIRYTSCNLPDLPRFLSTLCQGEWPRSPSPSSAPQTPAKLLVACEVLPDQFQILVPGFSCLAFSHQIAVFFPKIGKIVSRLPLTSLASLAVLVRCLGGMILGM